MCSFWLAFLLFFSISLGQYRLIDFGGIPSLNTEAAARQNSISLQKAFIAANQTTSGAREVVIDAGEVFYFMNSTMVGLYNVTWRIGGTLFIYNNISAWPTFNNDGGSFCTFSFNSCNHLRIIGETSAKKKTSPSSSPPVVHIDGQGYDWWWFVIITGTDKRPHMMGVFRSWDVHIEGLRVRNSPQFHFLLSDVARMRVAHVDIRVDVEQQKKLWEKAKKQQKQEKQEKLKGVPVFPLNTDGIDPSGINITIEHCYIENFDDAVAIKSQDGNSHVSHCTQNVYVHNLTVHLGVGATIGSVTPSTAGPYGSCIRNVTFDVVRFYEAIKAVYIKTNPAVPGGKGLIDQISYKNLEVYGSIWYPIYIGPQQEEQPHQPSKGCSFFFPLPGELCPTDPEVTISRVSISNSVFFNGTTLPGIILCDPANPCKGFVMNDVHNYGKWDIMPNYYCQNAEIRLEGIVNPVPSCNVTKE